MIIVCNPPNAKKNVKIAENTFPIIVETANLKKSLALLIKSIIQNEEKIDNEEEKALLWYV